MTDIVPELYNEMVEEFDRRVKADKRIQSFLRKYEKGTASQEAVSLYAANLGECAAQVFEDKLNPEDMPGEKLYWNILERTVDPLMRKVFDMVMEAASTVMMQEDEKIGIHLKPVIPDYPAERVKALMESMLYRENNDE